MATDVVLFLFGGTAKLSSTPNPLPSQRYLLKLALRYLPRQFVAHGQYQFLFGTGISEKCPCKACKCFLNNLF